MGETKSSPDVRNDVAEAVFELLESMGGYTESSPQAVRSTLRALPVKRLETLGASLAVAAFTLSAYIGKHETVTRELRHVGED